MTLSLDDVRNVRFRMARKSGYEVLEVDTFVDQVEEAFAQLLEENDNLKKQVDSLKSSPAPSAVAAEQPGPRPAVQPAPQVAEPSRQVTGPEAPLVVTTSKEASAAVVRLVEMSTDQAERLVAEAKQEAAQIRDQANRQASQVTTDATTRAERLESEARVNADRLQSDARSRAEQLDRDLQTRRSQLFSDLEKQRDQLAASVQALRDFEQRYRSNLVSHLRGQIQTVESGRFEPDKAPELIGARNSEPVGRRSSPPAAEPAQKDESSGQDASPRSDTPRLDALLGEQR